MQENGIHVIALNFFYHSSMVRIRENMYALSLLTYSNYKITFEKKKNLPNNGEREYENNHFQKWVIGGVCQEEGEVTNELTSIYRGRYTGLLCSCIYYVEIPSANI